MLEAGAALEDPQCMFAYGMKLLAGDGVQKDELKGLAYLEAAGGKGQDEAALGVALYYRQVSFLVPLILLVFIYLSCSGCKRATA